MSSNPNDMTALTPGHFLIGEPTTSIVDPQAQPRNVGLLKRWRLVTHLKDEFWRRWVREYLSELQHRHKWKEACRNVEPGLMVIIKDDNLPVLQWPLGRIIKTFAGDDGLVRVADVRTASGVLKRPVHKLAPLPILPEEEEQRSKDDTLTTINHAQTQDFSQKGLNRRNIPSTSAAATIDEATEPDSSHSKKARRSRSPFNLLLMTCLIMPMICKAQVKIEPFQTQPGIYFEGMGPAHLISNEWSLVVYYDIKPYWKELDAIYDSIEKLKQACNMIPTSKFCAPTVNQFKSITEEMKANNEFFLHQTHPRIKRAPLNIVGNIASSLFGVLDSTYAEEMSKIIGDLEGNQQYLLELLKNQTTLIDSTANIMKKSQDEIDGQLREFDKYLNMTISRVNAINQEMQEQRLREQFNELSVHLILMVANYQRVQAAILDVLIDTHHGKVNPQLLSPRQLQKQLTTIKENLPPTVRLPDSQNNLLKLYGLMTVEGRVVSNEIIFRIKLPLFSYEAFEILRVIPVPVPVNGTFITIAPSANFLIVNLQRDQYYPLNHQELSTCTIIDNSVHMCRQHHPLYRRGSNFSSCEMSLLTHSRASPHCKISKLLEIQRWIQLLNPNSWIYVMNCETTINILCGNNVSQKRLNGSGIITISPGCAIKEEFSTIEAYNIQPQSLRTSFIPAENLINLLQPSEVSKLLYQPISRQALDNDISMLKKNISNLRTEEFKNLKSRTNHDIHQLSVGYISIAIGIILGSYIAWKIYNRYCEGHKQQPPVPKPRTIRPSDFQLSSDLDVGLAQGSNAGENV